MIINFDEHEKAILKASNFVRDKYKVPSNANCEIEFEVEFNCKIVRRASKIIMDKMVSDGMELSDEDAILFLLRWS